MLDNGLLQEFRDFRDEVYKHQLEGKIAIEQVREVYSALINIQKHTAHLQKLEVIADSILASATQKDERLIKVFYLLFKQLGIAFILLVAWFTGVQPHLTKILALIGG